VFHSAMGQCVAMARLPAPAATRLTTCSSRRQQTLSLGINDRAGGARADGFDDVPYLFRIDPELPLMNDGNIAAPARRCAGMTS
jgi:hypothetical protein